MSDEIKQIQAQVKRRADLANVAAKELEDAEDEHRCAHRELLWWQEKLRKAEAEERKKPLRGDLAEGWYLVEVGDYERLQRVLYRRGDKWLPGPDSPNCPILNVRNNPRPMEVKE